ncbi:MAG: hypothetical protein HKN00_03280 [Flavobacteriaceae bacterium]|nr:polysaccharide deacetylase family protein [Bacteroidia bacterium]MBT8287924.1 polysaccharide deacetylase family protein [Bacteroidia bacterium]NNF74183.1 hypothetical protein [Flavobacteriaceae bacterium]NNK73633.1 hypothetical protein [Flavobacteriaceae bacterium]
MLLVYSHSISPRLKYIFKQICTRILNLEVKFTTKVESFIAHDSLKLSYTMQPLGSEFHIRSHQILFEQGISDLDISVSSWDETKCFFFNGDKSSMPFDIFAASFYLLSRYEEYLPHVKDEFGRFSAEDSLAYKHGFLHEPVVDIWAFKFRDALKQRFPNFSFTERQYRVRPVIDVPMAYYFIQKGVLRTIGGTFNDIINLKLKRLYQRYMVLMGFKKDPYDTFNWIINKQKKFNSKFRIFFLIGKYSTYDKNISINRKKFVSLIKSVADYVTVGLKASYFALSDFKTLKTEKRSIESVINTDLECSRNSFSRLNLPNTYRDLIELEVREDYTMGYVNHAGFRAGTCTPFLFYDIDYEIQTPLVIYPYHLMDYTLLDYNSLLDKKEALSRLIQKVKAVKGTFIPVFHNYTFSSEERWKGFRELFSDILNSEHEN